MDTCEFKASLVSKQEKEKENKKTRRVCSATCLVEKTLLKGLEGERRDGAAGDNGLNRLRQKGTAVPVPRQASFSQGPFILPETKFHHDPYDWGLQLSQVLDYRCEPLCPHFNDF